MEMSVPDDKVAKAMHCIKEAQSAKWVYVEAVQRLLGILAFIGRVLLSGMWHLSCTIMALRVSSSTGFVAMSEEWKGELTWWGELLQGWNCKAIMMPAKWLAPKYETTFFTDASRSEKRGVGGAGGIYNNLVFQFDFTPEEIAGLEIADLEGMAHYLWLVELCERCPEDLAGNRFVTRCDNQNFCDAVNDRKATTPSISFLVGEMHKIMALNNFDVRIDFVASKDNEMADALSRKHWRRVAGFLQAEGLPTSLGPEKNPSPVVVCEEWEQFIATHPMRRDLPTVCWVDIQASRRSSVASSLIQRRRWARRMRREQSQGAGQV
jgi:hypothetical protein